VADSTPNTMKRKTELAARLLEVRNAVRGLDPEWRAHRRGMGALLAGYVGQGNPLAFVLPILETMIRSGDSPGLLLAVAVDMIAGDDGEIPPSYLDTDALSRILPSG
jgi:hypothetical protein